VWNFLASHRLRNLEPSRRDPLRKNCCEKRSYFRGLTNTKVGLEAKGVE
jgi:hypothetical protein